MTQATTVNNFRIVPTDAAHNDFWTDVKAAMKAANLPNIGREQIKYDNAYDIGLQSVSDAQAKVLREVARRYDWSCKRGGSTDWLA